MKREICCDDCACAWRRLIGQHPGEYVRVKSGTARGNYRCDGCNAELPQGDFACISEAKS